MKNVTQERRAQLQAQVDGFDRLLGELEAGPSPERKEQLFALLDEHLRRCEAEEAAFQDRISNGEILEVRATRQ